MRIPHLVVLRMKSQFDGWKEVYRMAKYADLPLTQEQAKRMWKGDFKSMPLEAVEAFWLVLGYEVDIKKIRVGY